MINDLVETLTLPPGLRKDIQIEHRVIVCSVVVETLYRDSGMKLFEGHEPNPEKVYHE